MVLAVQAIRKMRGGTQSLLILGEDGNLWIVKFQNNPQHLRVLANEYLVSQLAAAVGLTVPKVSPVEVAPWLVEHETQLEIEVHDTAREQYRSGIHFGSRYVGGKLGVKVQCTTVDYLTEELIPRVCNLREFAGILALDKWTANCDGRQAVFVRQARDLGYTAYFIDHGFCFSAGEWEFPDSPLRGVYGRNSVYCPVTGWESFSPWIERLEEFPPQRIWEIAQSVPPEWFGGDFAALDRLVARLISRRTRIRELIEAFGRSDRKPFPRWR